MRQLHSYSLMFAGMTALLLFPTGCTLKATFDSTSDATSNFMSSTTPGAWVTQDGLLQAEYKVHAFTALNQANLEQDIARGQGEYLNALGSLLNVADDHQAAFRSKAQDAFGSLAGADHEARNLG